MALDCGLSSAVSRSRLLVVGAGGIGCELLKNLVLAGFRHIDVIDLDTIDVSNLNRQFLFQKNHVGKSKAQVARESVLLFCPEANITAHHDSITNLDYNVEFFKKFTLVMNALDNRAARNHVNRMCLAADIPLVESGSAGYLGQVTVIKKGVTECYECQPKQPQKTYPGCTIRNTPSEPIHCIVWAKFLFNQLFGEEDADQEVSPDTADPEAKWGPGEMVIQESNELNSDSGNIKRVSTRAWAKSTGYNPVKVFNKLFHDDINYLLTMDKLWKTRCAPVPLSWEHLEQQVDSKGVPVEGVRDVPSCGLPDQRVLEVHEQARLFMGSLLDLQNELQAKGNGAELVWDKEEKAAMDFVSSAANLRMFIFSMPMKSRFDVKSMAGNIIPAIATTNAIIAGLIVLEAFKVLTLQLDKCHTVFLNRKPNPRKKLLVPCLLVSPNPGCFVCSSKPQALVRLNTTTMLVHTLQEKVLKERFGMVAPDVQIEDGRGTILISSEEGETEVNNDRPLSDFGVRGGSRLQVDDFLQDYTLIIDITHSEDLPPDVDFEVLGDAPTCAPIPKTDATPTKANGAQAVRPSTSSSHSLTPGQSNTPIDLDGNDGEEATDGKRKGTPSPQGFGRKRTHSDSDAVALQSDDDLILCD
uniref:SUMO-activating enzyme subunit 2 isoform X2 n=1 Tax=Myxine glutinosa TaxID=7769 RepID=UPI00358E19E1